MEERDHKRRPAYLAYSQIPRGGPTEGVSILGLAREYTPEPAEVINGRLGCRKRKYISPAARTECPVKQSATISIAAKSKAVPATGRFSLYRQITSVHGPSKFYF